MLLRKGALLVLLLTLQLAQAALYCVVLLCRDDACEYSC
jgi:hypothetical protein